MQLFKIMLAPVSDQFTGKQERRKEPRWLVVDTISGESVLIGTKGECEEEARYLNKEVPKRIAIDILKEDMKPRLRG